MIASIAIAVTLSAAPGLSRLPVKGGGAVAISAVQVRYSFRTHRVEYSGDPVRLTRDDATLTCKKLGVQLNEADEVLSAVCEGDVRFERADRVVTCEKATYDEVASKLICDGNPELHSGGLSAKGTHLVYDLVADEVTMDKVEGSVPGEQADHRLKDLESRRARREGPR